MVERSFSDFATLYNYCQSRYHTVIEENLDVLYRQVLATPLDKRNWTTVNRIHWHFGSKFLMQTHFGKTFLTKVRKSKLYSKCNLLVSFRSCRRDQQAFFFPVCDILRNHGVKIAIFISKKDFSRQISPELFGHTPFIFSEDCYSFGAWGRAWNFYRGLRPSISALCNDLHLDQEPTQRTHNYFQQYALDKEIFGSVLKILKPSLIYGIHYIPNPGYLAAISDLRKTGHRIMNILIQHGPFPTGEVHDFRGADQVLLWGEHYQSILNSIRTIPIPASIPLGNPKLEVLLANREDASKEHNRDGMHDIDILYVGTPDTSLTGTQNKAALELFAQAVNIYEGVLRVVYKMHPAEGYENYQAMVKAGFIKTDQIVRDVSVYQAIEHSRIVVGTVTAVLPEAMAMGKPVVQIKVPNLMTDWHNYGISTASTQEELRHQLDMILGSSSYRQQVVKTQNKLVRAMFGEIEGSADRIADHLLNLL